MNRLFNILTASSLAAFIAILSLWILTHPGGHYILGKFHSRRYVVCVNVRSAIAIFFIEDADHHDASQLHLFRYDVPAPFFVAGPSNLWRTQENVAWTTHKAQVWRLSASGTGSLGPWGLSGLLFPMIGFSFSYAPLLLLFAVFPLFWLLRVAVKLRQKARQVEHLKKGFCTFCGYDLQATPQLCPECGRVPAQFAISNISNDQIAHDVRSMSKTTMN